MVLPSPILLGLELVPAQLRLGIFNGPLAEIAMATPMDEALWRGIQRGIEEGIGAITTAVPPDHQPLDPGLLALGYRPHWCHGELLLQQPPFGMTYLNLMPLGPGTLGQGSHFHWFIAPAHLWPGGPTASLAPSSRDSHLGFLEVYSGVRWHLGCIQHPLGSQVSTQLAVPPIKGVTSQ